MKLKKLSALFMIPALAVSLAACGGGDKPSKEEVTSGLSKLINDEMGQETIDQLGQDALDNYYSCIVDKTYDDLSDDTLRSIADAKEPKADADSDDAKAFQTAVTDCASDLMDDATSNLGG